MNFQRLNPPGLFEHPAFTRIISVTGPAKIIWISGQTPQNPDLSCVAPGDFKGQYVDVMNKLTFQLKAVGATWNDVTFQRIYTKNVQKYLTTRDDPSLPKFYDKMPCSTLIGVTELANPDFLLEIEIMAALAP